MQVVVDSVSVQHLLRSLQTSKFKKRKNRCQTLETRLDVHLRKGKVSLAVDNDGGLIDEWARTCGGDTIKTLVTQWAGYGAIIALEPENKIRYSISKKLKQLGFTDGIDRLILRIAMVTEHRMVVSDDSDFWDPTQIDSRGNEDAPVARLIREELAITIVLLAGLFHILGR